MKCIPRASFSIAILDDEDFGVLMEDPGGMEAFGLFVAIVIAGRSRLQLDRAERVGETDALVFFDRVRHLISMVQADRGQFDRCLAAFDRVAKETGGEPWLRLDQDGRLVVRSFFKFNTNTGWGGARDGAGRKSSGNQVDLDSESSRNQDGHRGNQVFQDDSKGNHLDSAVQSSGLHSGTGTGTGTNPPYIPPQTSDETNAAAPKASSPAKPATPQRSQPSRAADDLADVRAAEQILAGDLRTEHVGMKLGREHNLPGMIDIAGWKWLVAAKKLVGPNIEDSARRSFKYFARIAENLTDADRKKLEAKAPPPPREPEYYVPKRRPAYKVITARDFEAKAG